MYQCGGIPTRHLFFFIIVIVYHVTKLSGNKDNESVKVGGRGSPPPCPDGPTELCSSRGSGVICITNGNIMRQTGEGKNQASAELAVLRRFRPNGTESCGIRSIARTLQFSFHCTVVLLQIASEIVIF